MFEEFQEVRIAELEGLISQACQDYYNGTPTVTDEVYDAWIDELAELREDSPQVTAIGAEPTSTWPKVRHLMPMGSLDKVNTPEELMAWVNRVTRPKPDSLSEFTNWFEALLCSDKLDGISIEIAYESGRFVRAVTRGDGEVGEDITPNVARMQGVLMELPSKVNLTVRGEIVMHKELLPKFEAEGYKNTRNGASGVARRLDGKGCEDLHVYFYQVASEDLSFDKRSDQFAWMKDQGLPIPRVYLTAMTPGVKTPQDIWVDYQQKIREELPYDIDGLVVELDELEYQGSLGETNGRPKGAKAFKFAAITRESVALRRVDQVGGRGLITPVAEFTPVRILGAEVARASLYNQKYVEEIGFDVGAKILVSRANDVIPRVVSVTRGTGSVSQPPTHCPECGAEVEKQGEYLVCPNVSGCPAQTEGRIIRWVKELNILEWGDTLVHQIVSDLGVRTIPDLYRLTEGELAGLERMGVRSAQKALGTLWGPVPLPLEHLLGAMSIPLCATATVQLVVDAGYDTLSKMMLAHVEDFQGIPGMGPRRATELHSWLRENISILEELQEVGVKIKERAVGSLTGKFFCFTGKTVRKRAELEALVKERGGVVKGTAGKGVTYLVIADPDSTSKKANAARKNGVTLISETQLLEMIGV